MAKALTFRFDTFGDRNTASSRLRAWRLGEFLAESGHRVLMNEGSSCDVYVCQKSRPFEALRRFGKGGSLLVYDFDDHLLLDGPEGHGIRDEVIAFINAADVVTVGNEHLLQATEPYHPNVFVLENPVDIGSTDLVRGKTAALKRIGWFGAPSGLAELAAVETAETVVTVTRGGDIAFELDTIDRTLTEFDLLLFPVEFGEWNLAKNANRLTKAVALGVPVLATATPEHVRAAAELGLDDRFLVRKGEAWDAKIAGLRGDFAAVQDVIAPARGKALELFSMQRIGRRWLEQIERALAGKGARSSAVLSGDGRLKNVALVAFSYRVGAEPLPAGQLADSGAGGSRRVAPRESHKDFLEVFDDLWDTVRAVEQDWIVLQPEGFHLTHGCAGEVARALRQQPDRDVLLLRSQELGYPPDEWGAYTKDLRETICRPRDPGVLVVRRTWLLEQPWRPRESLSYWTWTLVVQAMSEGTLGVISAPVAWRKGRPAIVNVCSEYAKWAARHGSGHLELPDPQSQWLRMSADVFSQLAERLPRPVAAAFALMASDPAALRTAAIPDRSNEQLERQLRSLYMSTSWRVTAPLRMIIRGLRALWARLGSWGRPQ